MTLSLPHRRREPVETGAKPALSGMRVARYFNDWPGLIFPRPSNRRDPSGGALLAPVERRAGDHSYRADIDGLRALAVGVVVLFHAWPTLLPGGFIGVDVFFVISGYLISGIILTKLHQGTFSYLEFFSRRARRIGPALVAVLLASLAIGLVILPYAHLRELGLEATAASVFSANILFWVQSGYFDGIADSKPLLHLWSLGVEEQFYLVWPMLLAAAFMAGARAWTIVLSVTVLSFIANLFLVGTYPEAAFFLLPGRLWELGCGGLLAWHHASRTGGADGKESNIKAWLGIWLIAGAVGLLDGDSQFPGWLALLPVLGSTLIIDAGQGAWVNRCVLAAPPFRAVGLISYPIYLWHWPLLSFAKLDGFPEQIWKPGIIALTLLLSYLTYRYVEVPVRFGRASRRRSKGIMATILAGMLLAGGLGQLVPVWQKNALRLPDWAVEDYRADARVAYREACFLSSERTATDFAQECEDGAGLAGVRSRPLVMLWGDSHAAHLYQGLLAQQRHADRAFFLAQFTASLCPPIFDVIVKGRPNCHGVTDAIEGTIVRLRPDVVIMAADWSWYLNAHLDSARISKTIQRLRAMGVADVIVMGPVPEWDRPLPDLLLSASRSGDPPEYLSNTPSIEMEATVRGAALAEGARYISAATALCVDGVGCLATVPEAGGIAPAAWDRNHFTTAGSIDFIDKVWDRQIAPGVYRTRSLSPPR